MTKAKSIHAVIVASVILAAVPSRVIAQSEIEGTLEGSFTDSNGVHHEIVRESNGDIVVINEDGEITGNYGAGHTREEVVRKQGGDFTGDNPTGQRDLEVDEYEPRGSAGDRW